METVKVIAVKSKPRCLECGSSSPGWLWGNEPLGTRHTCDGCKTVFVAGRNLKREIGTIWHYTFQRGLANRPRPSWQYFPKLKRVYISCPLCQALLPIALQNIDAKGFVGGKTFHSCTVCPYCRVHDWPFLEGWAEFLKETKKKRLIRKKKVAAKAKSVKQRTKTAVAV